jgi:hypothetical protein
LRTVINPAGALLTLESREKLKFIAMIDPSNLRFRLRGQRYNGFNFDGPHARRTTASIELVECSRLKTTMEAPLNGVNSNAVPPLFCHVFQ